MSVFITRTNTFTIRPTSPNYMHQHTMHSLFPNLYISTFNINNLDNLSHQFHNVSMPQNIVMFPSTYSSHMHNLKEINIHSTNTNQTSASTLPHIAVFTCIAYLREALPGSQILTPTGTFSYFNISQLPRILHFANIKQMSRLHILYCYNFDFSIS